MVMPAITDIADSAVQAVAGGQFYFVGIGRHDDAGGFNQGEYGIADFQIQSLAALASDGGANFLAAFQRYDDFVVHRTVFDVFYRSSQLVACAGFHHISLTVNGSSK